MLVAGLVAASMFLQAAMTYGKLPLILGQWTPTARTLGISPGKFARASYPQVPSPN
jgi:lipopolysaccharide export LptBFGC system permease protein LptF